MKFRRARWKVKDPLPRLPLAAFIDVVLFMLLYFLIAGSLSDLEHELPSGLQTERGQGGATDSAPQVVSVRWNGSNVIYQLGELTLTDRKALTDTLRRLPKEQGVFVKVSGRVPVAAAATALQACNDAGFSRVSYVPSN